VIVGLDWASARRVSLDAPAWCASKSWRSLTKIPWSAVYSIISIVMICVELRAEERTDSQFTGLTPFFSLDRTISERMNPEAEFLSPALGDRSPRPNSISLLTWPVGDEISTFRFLKVADEKSAPSEPDIEKPGPDFGDYPNSAYTLPKGRAYIEMAPLSYLGPDQHNSASNSMPYLFRYGVTDDVEFRLTGSGLSSAFDPETTVVGFAPLLLDTKIHLWDDQIEKLIPAVSFEAFLQTNLASPSFQTGFQPSININMDFPFTEKTNLEMTVGYSSVQDAVHVVSGRRFIPRLGHSIPKLAKQNLNVNQFSFQFALEQQVTEKVQIFLQGYYNGDVYRQSGIGKVIGVGYFYQLSKVSTFFNSYNFGISQDAPNFSSQVGFAFAF
jgi:hypothetical protein